MQSNKLTPYAWLSIAAALLTMGLKLLAWQLTGSVGLLSDALESLVNLGGAVMALLMLRVAAQPPDDDHAYGHSKAEYFSSGFEGLLILIAGTLIVWAAVPRLWAPIPLSETGLGLGMTFIAAVINFVVARILLSAGQRHGSVTLTADARHLMTDVWTSAGIIVGVAAIAFGGWPILDPLIAIAVAAHILWAGGQLVRDSVSGLMDSVWPDSEQAALQDLLEEFREDGIDFHAIRTRRAAARRFVSFHVLVPGAWTVQRGHDFVEKIEFAIAKRLPNVTALTHLEPIEDPASYEDRFLHGKPG